MPDEQLDGLAVDAERVKKLAQAYEQAADQVAKLVSEISYVGRLTEPWAGDKVSQAMATHFNAVVLDDPYSSFSSLRKYEDELYATSRNLRQIHAQYGQGESQAIWHMRQQ